MNRKPFGVLDPLKYALRALVSQWQLALCFAGLIVLGEGLGRLVIRGVDLLFGGEQFGVVVDYYHKLALEYQRMTLFDVSHKEWINALVELWPIALIVGLVIIFFHAWIMVGLTETVLQWHDTGKISIKNLFSSSFFVVVRLVPFMVMLLVVFILLAIFLNYLPGLYFGKEREDLFHSIKALIELYVYFRSSFVAYYMIDKKVSLANAMQNAYHPNNWQGGQLFEAYFVTYLFDIGAGFIPYVGIGIGGWIICCAEIFIYRKLVPYQKSVDTSAEIISG